MSRLDIGFQVSKAGTAAVNIYITNPTEAETAIQIIEKIAEIQKIMNAHAKGEIRAVEFDPMDHIEAATERQRDG